MENRSRNTEPQTETLAQRGNIRIIKPNPPAIPTSEGTHFQVTTTQGIPWREQAMREISRMAFFALPVASLITQWSHKPDLWANIHLNANFNRGVNVFGRRPDSATSWGKPVILRNVTEEVTPENQTSQRVIDLYVGLWTKLLPQVTLFPNGIEEINAEEILAFPNDKLLWANEKFNLILVGDPHLSGLHLIVKPRETYWNPKGGFKNAWQIDYQSYNAKPKEQQEHIQGFLESMAILTGAERILLQGDDALDFYNPEIHSSGNWAKELQLDHNKLTKEGKIRQRIGKIEEWSTIIHGHLYATRNPNQFVTLPSRPRAEVPHEWQEITPVTSPEANKIEQLIRQRLGPWLQEHARDNLI